MATKAQNVTNVKRHGLRTNGNIKSKAVVEAMDGCNDNNSKVGRLGNVRSSKPQVNGIGRCSKGLPGRTALRNIGNVETNRTRNIQGATAQKFDKKTSATTRLARKTVLSKAISTITSKGQDAQKSESKDKGIVKMDVDAEQEKPTNDVPMDEKENSKNLSPFPEFVHFINIFD